ncbi:signal peptidase I [Schumannella sp. 10F1B-5-1]|uniref:signal peptidase I n=1 Tax=Schumannella sp. 10F1B-5-1 TaxID=2590780 RepID=UPI0011320C43|nr:signal peptidase I [Schumannella sp. 10F1B-5-1]TPW72346.1 signal peptidase I [Schumannella sp. 10F1B-5-1]
MSTADESASASENSVGADDEVVERPVRRGTEPRTAHLDKRKPRGWKLFLRDLVVIVVAAVVISFLIKTFLIRSFYIPSESMESTLIVNDRVIVNELQPKAFGLSRGDIVVFKDPGGWLDGTTATEQPTGVAGFFNEALGVIGLTAPDSDDHLIKRVIGLPGDTVKCCNSLGQMTVNDVPLDEPYVKLPDGTSRVSAMDFEVTVPKDSLWVMGDNRYNSKDSRYNQQNPGNGFVPYDNVVGRAFVISWPTSRWTWLDDYPLTFEGVPDRSSSAKSASG